MEANFIPDFSKEWREQFDWVQRVGTSNLWFVSKKGEHDFNNGEMGVYDMGADTFIVQPKYYHVKETNKSNLWVTSEHSVDFCCGLYNSDTDSWTIPPLNYGEIIPTLNPSLWIVGAAAVISRRYNHAKYKYGLYNIDSNTEILGTEYDEIKCSEDPNKFSAIKDDVSGTLLITA